MSIRFDIDGRSLTTNRRLISWYRLFAAEATANAQQIAGGRIKGGSGMYERSFTSELVPGSPPKLLFGNSAPHAIYLEEGTETHPVAPTKKKALRWWDPAPRKGQVQGSASAAVFSKGHEVKGIDAMHIVRDAVKVTGENLRRGTQRAAFVD